MSDQKRDFLREPQRAALHEIETLLAKSPVVIFQDEPHHEARLFKPYWMDPETGGGGTQKAIEILNHHAVGTVVLVRSEHRSTIIRRLDGPRDLPDVNDLFGIVEPLND